MSFHYGNRLMQSIWIFCSAISIDAAVHRHTRHGGHDSLAVFQIGLWSFILFVSIWTATIRWRFEIDALELRFFGARIRRVLYGKIISVEPVQSGDTFVIVYNRDAVTQPRKRMMINTPQRADFLEQLEQRAPQAHFHV